MKFRPHRGGLAEAMKEMVEVDGLAGLIDHLRKTHPDFGPKFDPARLRFEPEGDDERIGWKDVHLVIEDGWGVVGFCEGNPGRRPAPLETKTGPSQAAR